MLHINTYNTSNDTYKTLCGIDFKIGTIESYHLNNFSVERGPNDLINCPRCREMFELAKLSEII